MFKGISTLPNPNVITLIPKPSDQSYKRTFITYQNTQGLGAILCESFPTCEDWRTVTLRCNLAVYAISAVAVNPRYDSNLPFHYILFSSSNGEKSATLNLLICRSIDCTERDEVVIDQGTIASLFASSISITLTTCSDGRLACPLMVYNKQTKVGYGTKRGINLCWCGDPSCINRNITGALVELGQYLNDPGPIYVGLTENTLPLISYINYQNIDDVNSVVGLKVSRYNGIGTNKTEPTVSTLAIGNGTGVNYAMASAINMQTKERQVFVIYTTDENTNLWAKYCKSSSCDETPMDFGNPTLLYSTKRKNATIVRPSINLDYIQYPMVAFFEVKTNSTRTYNSIIIARCTINCETAIVNMVESVREPSVEDSKLASQFLFGDPAVVYMRTNGSLEYIRCQDWECIEPAMLSSLDDAVSSPLIMVQPINKELFLIACIVGVQLCLFCIWLSEKHSKRSDFISKYVTTPYLSTVKMTPRSRSLLRFFMSGSFFFALLSIAACLVCAYRYLIQLSKLLCPLLIPPGLGFLTWMLMRKARGGRFVSIKTLLLTGLWVCSVVSVIYALDCLLRMEFSYCSQINQQSLKIVTAIGGIGEIVFSFMWIFLLNNIRLALKRTKPESLLGANRWMVPHVQQNWARNVNNRQITGSGNSR